MGVFEPLNWRYNTAVENCLRVGGIAFILLFMCLLLFVPAKAAHKLQDSRCNDCHSIGGGRDSVVPGTHLIKKDIRIAEIQSNSTDPWIPGQPLPCVYCHDSDTVRTNMVGIKNHFSSLSISRHPVNYLTSSTGSIETELKCLDCHTTITYLDVGGPANTLNPNIHGVDTASVGWTQGTGNLDVTATYPGGTSPANTDNNTFCTQRCHDPAQTGFASGIVAHGFTSGTLSLEYGNSSISTIAGCLDEGSLTGCHSPHNSDSNVDLITMDKNPAGEQISGDDCGICHTFDDPPKASSDWAVDGHGRFEITNGINCTSCHDSSLPHFNSDGTASGTRLNFVEDSNLSDISQPAKSILSNCVSSNCHAGKAAHSTGAVNVGCLDCHDPHGYGVGNNLNMTRNAVPVTAPTGSIYFETTGAFFDSSFMGTSNYSNWMCDSEDCHSLGPGPIADIMSTSPANTTPHTGGTGIVSGCGICHVHDDSGGSFRASDSCTTCHGQPPVANYAGGTAGYAFADTRNYLASGYFKEEDKTPHAIHAAASPTGYNFDCDVCHLRRTNPDYHLTSVSNPNTFRNVIFDTAFNPDALAEGANKYSLSYSISASTPNVCLNLYCHSDGQGFDPTPGNGRFNTVIDPDQAWDDSTVTTLDCESCHGSNRPDSIGDTFLGAPDYANGGTAGSTYSAGSALTVTKANSHLDTTRHGRYTCSVCHYDTIRDTDASDGYAIFNFVHHVDGNIDVLFDGTTALGSYTIGPKTCQVACHSNGAGSREAYSGTIGYSSAVWGGSVNCGDCHAIGTSLTTGSHSVHVDSITYLNGPGITCSDCHISETDPEHADGKVDFNDLNIKSATNVCDTCHGGATDGALAKSFWDNPLYGDYSSGVTCESCHENDADGAAEIDGVIAHDTATGFVGSGHGNVLGLPWSGNAPGQTCVNCHDYSKPHFDGIVGYMGNLPRPLNTIDGTAVGSTTTTDVNTWCRACHDGSPGGDVITHGNVHVSATSGYREPPFALNCNDCHDPHSDAQNIYMVMGTVTNTAATGNTTHAVTFLNSTGVNSFDDTSSTSDPNENQSGTADVCATCHYDPSTLTTWNQGGEASSQHGERRGTDCRVCHVHKLGFVATCDQCHEYPPTSAQHSVHLNRYGLNSCDNCHLNNSHNDLAVSDTSSYAGAGSVNISNSIDIDLTLTDFDGVSAWSYSPGSPNSGTCNSLYCHGEFTVIGANSYTDAANWGSLTSGACGTCHSIDNSQATGSHTQHVGAGARDYGFRYDCLDCHQDVQGYGAGAGDASHVDQNPDVAIASTYGGTAAYDSSALGGTRQIGDTPGSCQNVTCHGSALDPVSHGVDITPDWGVDTTGDCGTCHLVDNLIAQGSHVTHVGTAAGQYDLDCVRCHSAVDNTNNGLSEINILTVHADLVTDVDFDSFNASASTYGTAGSGLCSDLYCHGNFTGGNAGTQPQWGNSATGTCGSCHDNPPSTFAHSAHLATVPNGPGADCNRCHGTGANTGDHPLHVDGNPDLYSSVTPSGSGPTLTCSPSWVTGCHNGKSTPPWNSSADCADCHAAGDGFPGDPVSALHVVASAYSAVVQAHDENLQAGTSPLTGCEVCHSGSPSDLHYNGIVNQKADTINFAVDLDFVAGTVPTCSPSGAIVSCHSDGGNWQRQWSDNAESLSSTLGDPRCSVCHGQLNDWRDGLTVDHNRTNINNGVHSDCVICHVYDDNAYDWVTHHESGDIQYNSNADLLYDTTNGTCSQPCHDNTRVMGVSSAFAESALLGPGINCSYCHGDESTDRIWPDNNGTNNTSRVVYADDQVGDHDNHILAIGQYLGHSSTIANYTPSEQITVCEFCHPTPGSVGHATDSGDQRVDLNPASLFLSYDVPAQGYTTDLASAAYNYTTQTCNLVCHNQNDTPSGGDEWNNPPDWTSGLDTKCSTTTCHDTVTYTNSHNVHSNTAIGAIRGLSYPCTQCHIDNNTDLAHQNGQVDMAFDNVLAGHLEADPAIGGGDGYYDKDNSGTDTAGDTGFVYKDGNYDRSCYNVYCHGDDWPVAKKGLDTTPVWNDWTTGSCGTCHGSVGSAWFSNPLVWTAEGPFTDLMDTGAHLTHFAQNIPGSGSTPLESVDTYGPNLNPHPSGGSCQTCHKRMRDNGSGCSGTLCHPAQNKASDIDLGDEHINGTVDYSWSTTLANEICDDCHGGAAGAAIAKTNWSTTGQRVTCESCHGDYTLARSRTNGTIAPERAGSAFDNAGHGNVSGTGSNCVDCHDEDSGHISHVLGDTNRLDVVSGNDYGTSPVPFCASACHGTTMPVHYDNTRTTGGATDTSDDGDNCNICHDPHGQSGFDAMIVSAIGGSASRTIASFPDRTQRSSYYVVNPGGANDYGVCQVCHDENEVVSFNRVTEEGISHNPGNVCTVCHEHNRAVAFESPECNDCHGNPATDEYYPTSGGVNGTSYPNRRGRHDNHVAVIANVNSLSTTTIDTCVWCHPSGGHSGDQSSAPADLPNGSTTEFLDILGNTDGGAVAASAQQAGANTVGCSGVDCHYETDLPDSGWYGGGGANCDTCHFWTTPYAVGELPNAHDIHVDEIADGGYDMLCTICHPSQASPSHQDGIVDMNFSALAHTDGDETVAGSGGAVKFGFGTSVNYYTCENVYCHGDFDDAGLGGGNVSNAPNWGVSSSGGCGTCHGDTGGTTESLKAVPVTGSSGAVHVNHVSMAATSPAVNCTVCHFISWGGATNGSYGNLQEHADGILQPIDLNNRFGNDPASVIADYEGSAAADTGGYGNVTCSNIKCHNSVTTPVWSDSSISGFGCGDCHQDAAASSPLPTWDGGVTGSHRAHADTDNDYTDCDKCHGVVAGVYTAFGGTNHQNLVVELSSLPGVGATYTDADPGGVNWIPSAGTDDGTCSSVSCHGAGTPQWGNASTVVCGDCHGTTGRTGYFDTSSDVDGAPPLTATADTNIYKVGKHLAHMDESFSQTGDSCDLCHTGAGGGSGSHGDGVTQVVFDSAAGGSAFYDSSTPPSNTCQNLICHDDAEWDETVIGGCNFCHGYPPDSSNNSHARGMSAVNHDSLAITSNHGECWYCHGVRDDGSSLPSVMGTNILTGSYLYSWSADHKNGFITMNGDSNADSSDDAGYDPANGGCDTAACHYNDALHQLTVGSSSVQTVDLGPATCSFCHGTDGVRYYPDTLDTVSYPDRGGEHSRHVSVIALRNGTVNTSDETSCDWCHPGGAHSGDQLSLPADLHDGSATHFKDIIGNIDSGESVAQNGTAQTVSCSGVNCHYNNTMPDTEWYVGSTGGCGYCHVDSFPYTPGDLPGSHDIHLDEFGDGGYGLGGNWMLCMACHVTIFSRDHQNGVVEVTFPDPGGAFPDAPPNAAVVSNGGPLTSRVKYGGGNSSDYYSCTGVYCHGDFDDGGISGGNTANSPNWWDTVDGGECGTCHGDASATGNFLKSYPRGASASSETHIEHLSSISDPGCSACHNSDTFLAVSGEGTYGDGSLHASGNLDIIFGGAMGESLAVSYEGRTPAYAASNTCSDVRCHNGVETPQFTLSGGINISCGQCHNDGTQSAPLPGWSTSVARSHPAHADTDADYTDCAVCHLATAANYTATGGTNHQDLVVNIALPGGNYSETSGGAGVNWATGSDGIDDGTCSVAVCHGPSAPVWGGTVTCGSCHDNGMPPVSGAHASHFADSDTDYTECIVCHGNNGDNYQSGLGLHVDGNVDVAGTNVTWSNSATAGTPDDDTCTTTVCHSAAPNSATWGDTTQAWGVAGSIDCNECHYWAAVPDAGNNGAAAGTISELSHDGHFAATGRTFVCVDCHAAVTNDIHITNRSGGDDGAVLTGMAEALQDEAFIDTSGSWFTTGSWDGTDTCTNVCHDPTEAGVYSATWGSTYASCTLCHSMSDPATGSHSAHLAIGIYGGSIDCASCHPDNGTVYDHMTGAVALSLSNLTYTGTLTSPYNTNFGTCSTITCHNDGQGNAVATSIWGTVNPVADCGICHAGTPSTQAHNEHLAHPTVDCADCHQATSTTSMSGQITHLNDTVNIVSGAASYDGGVSVGDTNYGSCDSGACHDAAVDIVWNATPTDCRQCHLNSADVNDFDGQNETASVVASDQWSGYGHSAQGVDCLDCHSLSTAHDFSAALDGTSNPFRLGTTGAPYAGTVDVFCSNTVVGCHNAAPASTVVSHTDEDMSADKRTWPSWDPKCIDCHDPHGDGSNLSMIQSDLFDSGSTTTGVPLASDADAVSFTTRDGIAEGSYADTASGGADSICQECHTGTVSFLDNDTSVAVTGAHPGSGLSPCTNCHKHDTAFEPSGCDSCHGDQAGSYWPADDPGSYPNRAGRHGTHINALMTVSGFTTSEGDQKAVCLYCHNDAVGGGVPGAGGHYETPSWTEPANVGDFDRIWDGNADSAGGVGTYNTVSDTCTSVDCHNNQTTAANFSWYASSTSVCSMCHDDVTGTGTATGITHTNHTGAAASFGVTVDCDTCHDAATDWGTSTPPAGGHRDGSWTVVGVAYTGSWEAVTLGTCGTNVCHNDGRGNAPATAYTWGSVYDNCNTCHIDSPVTSSHDEHLASTVTFGLTIGCADCHSVNAEQQSTHIDSQVTLTSYASSYDGGVAVGDTNFGSCLTNYCHNDGTGAAAAIPGYTWSQSLDDCNTCHIDSPASGNHATHLETPYGPFATCGECHEANNNNTTMAGQTSHISGTVDFASATTLSTTAACDTCHGGSTAAATARSYWNSTDGQWLTDGGYCESCHGDNQPAVIDTVTAPVRAGALFTGSGHGKIQTPHATFGGDNCVDCHDELSSHISGALGDTNRLDTVNGNDYGSSINDFCANSCHATVVNAHYDNGWTSGGNSDDGNRCDLCHDPHGQSGHDAMISGAIGSPAKTVVGFTDKAVRSSYFVADTSSGYGVCQVCHDPAEVGHFNRSIEEDATHFTGRVCTDCHLHTTAVAFEANCGACHAEAGSLPQAHSKHAMTQTPGGVQISCDVCHGVGAQTASHPGHAAGGETVLAGNITLVGDAAYPYSQPSWFGSTWGGSSFFGATDISYTDTSDFTCDNVRCHGGESVVWNQAADAGATTYSDVCFNCHNITSAAFQLPSGTLRQATNAAANYIGPISGFSRGGHGDTFITDPQWFEDTADGASVPVGCTACHDESKAHFPVATANPYRVSDAALANNLPGRDSLQTRITNLCTQNNCHPQTRTTTSTGTYAFTEAPKHPNDHFTDWVGGTSDIVVSNPVAPINLAGSSSTTSPQYDPVGVTQAVGVHIDRYVDHWEWRNPSSPATGTNSDDVPFLPLGDSLGKQVGDDYNNDTGTNVTCITCHNPHGTDLHVVGQTPGSGATVSIIPANKMLRLRDQDSELCNACH